MTEQKFRSEMRRAMAMEKTTDTDRAEYWRGYQRGLRRAYHGEKFGTPEEHTLWLSLIERDDERSKQRGQGYRDGIAFEEISSRMGRPPMSDEQTETVGVRLPESIVSRIPEPRSEWIRNLIIKNLPE
jgi:hypothetical protein